jgi:hypothetical protein
VSRPTRHYESAIGVPGPELPELKDILATLATIELLLTRHLGEGAKPAARGLLPPTPVGERLIV